MAAEQKVTRKLRAILSADVKGYSTLMTNDEVYTIQTLKEYRQIMSGIITDHSGNVVDMPGDNIMAEFSSVVNAVQSSVAIQKALKLKNNDLPHDKHLEFRIGINIGDVVQDGDSLYGEGVNIAARIEGLADPGGICISRGAYDHIRNKLNLGYEYIGEHTVKNIKNPVRVYKILMAPEDAGKVIGERLKPSARKWALSIAIALTIIFTIIGYQIYQRMNAPEFEPATVENMALPLPEKPSIAVLPFENMSDDPDKEYLSDGITEQIITSLSKVPRLFVISRTSTFSYKNKPVKIQQVSQELGVRYVLEGSVQQSGGKIRITAQLIDALTGRHLWAERYERNYKDIFALQDEITLKILNGLQIKLTEGERVRFGSFNKRTPNLKAFEKIMEGTTYIRAFTIESNETARRFAREAIELDPEFYGSYNLMASVHFMDVWLGSSKSPPDSLNKAIELLQKSIALEENNDGAYSLLCHVYAMKRQFEKSIAAGKKAIEINPNSDAALVWLAMTLRWSGKLEKAIELTKQAIRLSPFPPAYYYLNLGNAYMTVGRFKKAIEEFKKTLHLNPRNFYAFEGLSICNGLLGREEESKAAAAEMMKLNSKHTIESWLKMMPHKDRDLLQRWAGVLRKAGVPEKPSLPLPDKPSIAVLAFDNMSRDPEQDFFTDSISESITATLSKIGQLFVIARNSSFSYKGKAVKVQQIGRELGVRYILEGSVLKTEDRVRVTAQLIDAVEGHHLWSERYDRDLKDIFALQDEIVKKIVTDLQIKLSQGEEIRLQMKEFENYNAYLKYLEAISEWVKGTKESSIRVSRLAQEIIDLEPESPVGYRLLGDYYLGLAERGFSSRENFKKAFSLIQKALSMDENNAYSHSLMCNFYTALRKYEKAIDAGKRAVGLQPNSGTAHMRLAKALCYAGQCDQGIIHCKQGIRFNPLPIVYHYTILGRCFFAKGQYEQALYEFKKAVELSPDNGVAHLFSAIVYGLLDRKEEAQTSAKNTLELYPNWSVSFIKKIWPYKAKDNLPKVLDALRKAGFPE